MSVDSIYVKASDGNFYCDPIINGDDYSIYFDRDELPMLVIKRNSKKKNDLISRAREIIKELDLTCRIEYDTGHYREMMFDHKITLHKSWCVSLEISSPPDAKHFQNDNDGVYGHEQTGTYIVLKEM